MFCPYCGKPNDDDSIFCCECGKRIEEPIPTSKPSANNNSNQPNYRTQPNYQSQPNYQEGNTGELKNQNPNADDNIYSDQNLNNVRIIPGSQGTGNVSYNRGTGNGSYNRSIGNDSYNQGTGNGSYNRGIGNGSYNQGTGNVSNNRGIGNGAYIQGAGNASYNRGAGNGAVPGGNKKKDSASKLPIIIICSVCAVVMIAIVIFAGTKLLGNKDDKVSEVTTEAAIAEAETSKVSDEETAKAETKEETKEKETKETTTEETTAKETTASAAETTAKESSASETTAFNSANGYGTWIINCSATDSVTLRTKPSITEDPVNLPKIQGQVSVKVLDVNCEGFFRVEVGGQKGYILGSYLDPTADAVDIKPSKTLTATEGGIHLLDLPHVSGSSVVQLATISEGETVNYYATTLQDQEGRTYYFVEYNGVRGYVVTTYDDRKLFK